MMKKILLSAVIATCIFPAQVLAASVAGVVEKGNRLYYGQKYEDASKSYDQALSQQPDSAIINFDSGTAQYKIKEYQKANSLFEKSSITEDKSLEAKANYNLGNSKYMLGLLKENTRLSEAVQLLAGALNNYKRTQELAPKDEDVKVNYKIVQEKLKELKEKLKQQPQENKNNQKQDQQNQEQKQNQEQGQNQQGESQQQSASAQNDQDKSQGKQGQDQQGQNKQPQQSGQEGQEKQGQSALAQSQEPKEMSKEEANMLLEGYRQEENATGMLKDDRKGTEEKVLKDW